MMFDEAERRGNPIFRVVQLMQFIMALKGAQFMMGVLLALEGFFSSTTAPCSPHQAIATRRAQA